MRPGCFSILSVLCVLILALLCGPNLVHGDGPATRPASALDYTVKDIDGKDVDLSAYKGKVVLIINVASKCGFTKQYGGLEKLYEQHKDAGLVLIGFPANNFNSQEPGTDEEIKTFCTSKYGVTFPMMSKISVKGDDKSPVYKFLTEPETAGEFAGEIKWNFNKFLLDRSGKIIARFDSKVAPDSAELTSAIEKALAEQ